jgi:molybdopterin synthase sulfur carrier subunit
VQKCVNERHFLPDTSSPTGRLCHPVSPLLNPRMGLRHHLSMPKIHIPTPLRQYAGKQPAIDVKAGTIGEALTGLVSQHPELRRHLYTDEGKLRAFVNVYLNDEDVRYLQKDATAVVDSDNISIVPSIAGGR